MERGGRLLRPASAVLRERGVSTVGTRDELVERLAQQPDFVEVELSSN